MDPPLNCLRCLRDGSDLALAVEPPPVVRALECRMHTSAILDGACWPENPWPKVEKFHSQQWGVWEGHEQESSGSIGVKVVLPHVGHVAVECWVFYVSLFCFGTMFLFGWRIFSCCSGVCAHTWRGSRFQCYLDCYRFMVPCIDPSFPSASCPFGGRPIRQKCCLPGSEVVFERFRFKV